MASQPNNPVAVLPSQETERFNLMQREAKIFAYSPLIPEHLRKGGEQQAIANCYIALKLAKTMGEDPLVVLQNIHIVSGKAGFSAQYMIARANASGVFAGRIDWRIDKSNPQNLSVTAFATLKDTGQEVSVTCDMAMAQAEQWTKNPKYKSMPEVMLRYRSATFLVRFYAPDVMLGYQTAEEVQDLGYAGGPDLTATPLTGAMLIDQAAGEGAREPRFSDNVSVIDAETGELIAGEGNDGTLADDNPTAAEGPADEQRGEGHADDEQPAWAPHVARIKAAIGESRTLAALGKAETEFLNIRAGLPDAVIANLEQEFTLARALLKGNQS